MAGEIEMWREVRLGDLVQITHGWPFKSELFSEELTGKPIVVNIGNFKYTGGFRFESTTLKEYRGDYPTEYELSPGDILLVMTCQTAGGEILGIPGRIPNDGLTYLHNQRLGKVVVKKPGKVNHQFLYWLFIWSEFNRELFVTASGTKILHTAPTRIEKFKFRLPPLKEQRSIACILGALDDKIELNRRMNQTLEAMARAIFKSWFVDFEPVRAKAAGRRPAGVALGIADLFPDSFEDSGLGEIPAGWKITTLQDQVEVAKGLSYKGQYLSTEGKGLPMHNLNSVYEGGGYKHEGLKWYNGEYRPAHLLNPGDVIVTNTEQGFDYLLIGYSAIVPERYGQVGLFSHHIYRLRPKQTSYLPPWFFYLLLRTARFHDIVAGHSNGTTVNMLPADGLQKPRIVLPPVSLVDRFGSLFALTQRRLDELYDENTNLAAIRDALLPKLISGELRVPDADRIVGRAI